MHKGIQLIFFVQSLAFKKNHFFDLLKNLGHKCRLRFLFEKNHENLDFTIE